MQIDSRKDGLPPVSLVNRFPASFQQIALVALGIELQCNGQADSDLPQRAQKGTKMKWGDINQLCDVVRETSFAIHKYHRNGHLEKVYENALVHRLHQQGVQAKQQHPLTVYDEDYDHWRILRGSACREPPDCRAQGM